MSHINRTIKPFELNAFRHGAEDFYTVSEKGLGKIQLIIVLIRIW